MVEQSSLVTMETANNETKDIAFQLEEIVHKIIGKVFSMQRYYDNETSELQHTIQMMTLKFEESENLKFDNEILSEEKQLLDREFMQVRDQLRDTESKLQEVRHQINNKSRIEYEAKKQLKEVQQEFEQQLAAERQSFERKLTQQT